MLVLGERNEAVLDLDEDEMESDGGSTRDE